MFFSFDILMSFYRRRIFSSLLIIPLVFAAQTAWTPKCIAGTLHAIISGDTTSPDISQHVGSNIYFFEHTLMTQIPAAQLRTYELHDKHFNWKSIKQTIDNIRIGQDDAILFYYCGHGFWTQRYGNFCVLRHDNNQRLYFSTIKQYLARKGARLVVIINDSCSVEPKGNLLAPEPTEPLRPVQVKAPSKSLFFEGSGSVEVNSSSPREYALCGRPVRFPGSNEISFASGTLYTSCFLERLQDPNANTWRNMHDLVGKDVSTWFSEIRSIASTNLGKAVGNQSNQTIQTFVNGKKL